MSQSFFNMSKKQRNLFNKGKDKEAFWEDVSNPSPITTKGKKPNGNNNTKERISHINTPRFIPLPEPSSHRNNHKHIDQDLYQYPPNNKAKDNFITFECSESLEKTTKEKELKLLDIKNNSICFEKQQHMNNLRVEKFNKFLQKYDKHKQLEDNARRTNHLYANAKMKNAYLEKLRSQGQTVKIRQETNECTFYPEINHRSRRIASADGKNVYERNIIWVNNKLEKIQHIRKIKAYEREEYPYKPKITDYCKESNSKKTIKTNLSTVLYLERQQKARHNKDTQYPQIMRTKYKSCSTEPSKRSAKISQTFLSQCKALLHEELVQSKENDD